MSDGSGLQVRDDPGPGFGPALTAEQRRILEHPLTREAARLEFAGDIPGAIAKTKEVLKVFPDSALVMSRIAGLYGKIRQFAEEETWAKRAIAKDPDELGAYVNLGNALAMQGRSEEAERAFRQALERDPKFIPAIYGLGVIEESKGNFTAAARYYEQTLEIDSTFANGLFNLAAMYGNLRRLDDAIVVAEQLVAQDPRDRDAQGLLQALREDRDRRAREEEETEAGGTPQ